MLGRIHSEVSFSKVDGPGIRYVVFMQGCNLRCRFCHNVDTWSTTSGKMMASQEIAKNILKALPYIKNSNGGVTISGGEPLLQIEFLIELFKTLKKYDINIALDTAGNFDTDEKGLDELLKYVDLVLFDIKHIDNEEHKKLVGFENTKILEMAKYISNVKQVPMWVRIVYIPGITDKGDSFKRYKEFIKKLKSVEKIEVLPYHELGVYKWKELGMEYTLKNIRIPTKEECKKIEDFLNT